MRIDKFLKVSRLIKRRTVAADACDAGRITINDRVGKPSTAIKTGDKVAIAFGSKTLTFIINDITENVRKDDVSKMYTIVGEE